jgi:DNA-binding transcriptional ArsR family regulator
MTKVFLSQHALEEAAHCLRILSHPVRLRIIQLLESGPRSVGEIAEECKIPHNLASTHLKLLERCRFLAGKRSGQSIRYSVVENHAFDLLRCIEKKFSKK